MASSVASTSKAKIPPTVVLTPEVVSSFRPSKVYRQHNEEGSSFTSISFDDKGEYMITASEDMTMQLFDSRKGRHLKPFLSKKYGAGQVRFTHASNSIIHTSTQEADDIRHLSLDKGAYVRYFKGHTKKVVSLAMSPLDDTFLSGATDDTVRFWDMRAGYSVGLLNIAGRPCVAYDPTGAIFCVALNLRSTVLFYDIKAFDQAPFMSVTIDDAVLSKVSYPPRMPIFTSLSFSNDGKYLLLGTAGDVHYVTDAYDGKVLARLQCPETDETSLGKTDASQAGGIMGLERAVAPPHARPVEPVAGISGEEVKWTPDGRYVVGGAIDGRVHVWDVNPPEPFPPSHPPFSPTCTLFPVASLDGHQGGPSRCVAFNPRAAMFASAGQELAFWLPDFNSLSKPTSSSQP